MSAWFKYWLALGLLLWIVGCGGSSEQSTQDISQSQVAQSVQGDAIAGQTVKVDKSTHIGTQINLPTEVLEQIERLNERRSKELSTFQVWVIFISFTILFLLISIGLVWFFWRIYIAPIDSRQYFITTLQQGIRRKFYRTAVYRLLDFLFKIYGGKSSLRAFNISFLLAYAYPILAFILTYSYFNGINSFSHSFLFSEQSIYRLIVFPIIIAWLVITYYTFKYGWIYSLDLDLRIIKYFEKLGVNYKLTINIWHLVCGLTLALLGYLVRNDFIFINICFFAGYATGILAILIFTITLIAYKFNMAILILGFSILFISFGRIFHKKIIITLSGLIFTFVLLGVYIKDYKTAMIISFFYLMMPLINALLDYLSWWVSRAFLEKTLQTDKVWLITLEVLIDALLAVLFMLALCLLLPAGAIALDSLFSHWIDADGQSATTNWQYYAYAAAVAPFGEGLMVTLMLWTTLLPTFIHLVLGCLAIIIFSLKGQALATFLINTPEGDRLRYTAASLWLYGYLLLSIGIVSALIWLILKLADLPIAAWLYEFTRYFYAAYGLPVV
ncbi:MAG: hypothetical protein WAQ53_16480 [Thiofilum sp.]|uniref:hypothetical protein n=1 Tax=Thiofilum sp. TaxID=2212733 RepID=UPI0025DDA091|nr:hypothetical protein [Thiofilum sp.]MBK8452446.1 hypothetical protein [Thiofilum sp.]